MKILSDLFKSSSLYTDELISQITNSGNIGESFQCILVKGKKTSTNET